MARFGSSWGLVLLALGAAGCEERSASNARPGPAPTPRSTARASARPSASVSPRDRNSEKARETLPAAARALVDTWVAAQNAKRFDDYAVHYAGKFLGVKRMGARERRYDREGWLRDRKAMFARGFQVRAHDVKVTRRGNAAVVTFEQVYTSPNYSDRGPKQLVVVLEDGAAKIAREEMLRSTVERSGATKRVPMDFGMVLHVAGRRYFVAQEGPGGQRIASPPEFLAYGAAFGPIDRARLPETVQMWAASPVAIYDGSERRCVTRLERWGVLVHFEPHFGMANEWAGVGTGKPVPDARAAREAFGPDDVEDDGVHRLVADITAETSDCEHALFGRSADVPPPDFYESKTPTVGDADAMEALIQRSPGYQRDQLDFRQSYAGKGLWHRAKDAAFRRYVFTRAGNDVAFALLLQPGGCGDFEGHAGGFFEKKGGSWVQAPGEAPYYFEPRVAFDLDGDGVVEWLGEHRLVGSGDGEYRVLVDVSPMSFDCPC